MWLQRFTNYILQHRWQALVLVFASTFVPVVGIVGIIVAAFITLRKGVVEGALFALAATLPYLISFYFSAHQEPIVPLFLWAAVGVAVLSNVLTWVFAVMLHRHTSWSLILQIAALMGVLVISIVHLVYPDVADWWGVQLQTGYSQAQEVAGLVNSTVTTASAAAPTDTQLEVVSATKQYATGVMVAAVLFNALLQLVAARWWQAIVFSPGALRRELHGIRLSYLAGVLFVVSLVLSYLGNSVVLDIMPVLYMLFGAAGLSLIHYFFGLMRTPTVWFWLALVYAALIISFPVSVVGLAILALADVWFDIRKRFRRI